MTELDGQIVGDVITKVIHKGQRAEGDRRAGEATLVSSIRIVPATESDIPALLGLIRDLAEYENLLDAMTATEEGLRETLFGARPAAEVLLAFDDFECAGYALFFPTYCTMLARPGLFLDNLYVKPHWRGRGIGNALLRRLAGIAAERNCGRLEWMVLDWNRPAIGFYLNEGAVLLDGWTKCRMTEEAIQNLSLSGDERVDLGRAAAFRRYEQCPAGAD